ncbi:MAG TPA: trypsin-like peptidase domain-containing protein [Solirubrobacteraceae bacterium]|nr:trypsin-like peptidase domain-containing protein [Solirubrobacteraceae bacterium]
MLVVDLIIGVALAAALIFGYREGLARALPLAGFAVGVVIASRLPLLGGVALDSDGALAIVVPAALLLGAAIAALTERFAWRLSRRARSRVWTDGGGGALVAVLAAVVAVWMLGPVIGELRPLRTSLERSAVLGQLDAVLQPAGPKRADVVPALASLPRYRGRGPDVAAGDPRLLGDPDVVAAERSVLKILVRGCGGHGSGSGWVADRRIVATNAHVVAGGAEIRVQRRASRQTFRAIPIWFDGDHDIALLRVPELPDLDVLPMVEDARAGTPGATLGFPRGRWAKRRARIGPTTARLRGVLGGRPAPGVSDEISGRLVTTIRGRLQPGNSGGPLVDEAGHVLTTAFAGGFGGGALGVPNEFVREGLRHAGPRVDTTRCR